MVVLSRDERWSGDLSNPRCEKRPARTLLVSMSRWNNFARSSIAPRPALQPLKRTSRPGKASSMTN